MKFLVIPLADNVTDEQAGNFNAGKNERAWQNIQRELDGAFGTLAKGNAAIVQTEQSLVTTPPAGGRVLATFPLGIHAGA